MVEYTLDPWCVGRAGLTPLTLIPFLRKSGDVGAHSLTHEFHAVTVVIERPAHFHFYQREAIGDGFVGGRIVGLRLG